MATPPSAVRRALVRVTDRAKREIRAVSTAAEPAAWRGVMFTAAPLVVAEYAPAASSLALDWFDDIREDANPARSYDPTPRLLVGDDDVAAMVARVTEPVRTVDDEIERMIADTAALLEAEIQKDIAAGFWDTMTGNADDDPAALGWRRYTRPGACKFCLMLAERGAVYTEITVDFAAHTNCHCLVGPAYDADAPKASALQYVASRKRRTPEQRAALREYLNTNFPDAPG